MVDLLTIGVLSFIFFLIQIFIYAITFRPLIKQLRPLVSKAFGILGKASGEKRAMGAVTEKMFDQIIDSPKFTALKMGAKTVGIDIDDMLGEFGAEKTFQGLLEIGAILGITPETLLGLVQGGSPQGLLGGQAQTNTPNPYLRRT